MPCSFCGICSVGVGHRDLMYWGGMSYRDIDKFRLITEAGIKCCR